MRDAHFPDVKPTSDEHAELMDRVYRGQRLIYDVTRRYYLFGRDRAIRELALAPGTRFVEVGCGTARNLVHIARRYPGTRLFGLDASTEMLRSAHRAISRAGLSDRVSLTHGYAESLSPWLFNEREPFGAILFSYSLSMIPDWEGALDAARRALATNGRIHIVDFGDFTGLGRWAERAMRSWLTRFHVTPRVDLLARLEQASPLDATLHLLPGRYAFMASLSGRCV